MADTELISALESSVSKISDGWKSVTSKKMFGCPAFWVNNNVFALVWKHGRIGVKLTDGNSYDSLIKVKGAEPWKAGPMKMAHWVLVPDGFHSDSKSLKKWLRLAYEQNEKTVAKAKKKAEAKSVKKKGK
jgi:TfoX/Sxy family transcriptional regulator of competence genes